MLEFQVTIPFSYAVLDHTYPVEDSVFNQVPGTRKEILHAYYTYYFSPIVTKK
jgi:hypothetical protein